MNSSKGRTYIFLFCALLAIAVAAYYGYRHTPPQEHAHETHGEHTDSERDHHEHEQLIEWSWERISAKMAAVKDENSLQAKTLATVDRALPRLVEHLNALSTEEQRTLLTQVQTQLRGQLPPELAEHTELIWSRYLEMLAQYGYQPPE